MVFITAELGTNHMGDVKIVKQMIDEFVSSHNEHSISFTSMGYLNYFSTLQFVDGVVGNSSSGLIEAASFNKFALNIGNRQLGRIRNKNVIDVKFDKKEIIKNCDKILNNGIYDGENIYHKEDKIEKVIEKIYEFF